MNKTLKNKFNEYIAERLGTSVDIDGKYGHQCVDLARDYSIYMFNENFAPHGYAKNLWYGNWGNNWTCITYEPGVIPKPGDLVIWGGPKTKYGHIAVIIEADENGFKVLEQNTGNGDGIGEDDNIKIGKYKYTGYTEGVKILGFVRNKMLEDTKGTYEAIYGDDLGIRDYESLYKATKNDSDPKEAIYAMAIIAKSVLVNLRNKNGRDT